ncbi:MAG TPA: hypothetical protein VN924_09105 [Bryobacteraceae bacterium]|nr:hypothetical protein [Bryobacteraceae bacterium]
MASWRTLFAVAAFLPGVAAATDPAMLDLIMPDARVVMEINLDHIASSPIGQAMSPQMKAQLSSLRPTWQDPLPGLGTLDWTRFAQEVVFASGPPAGPGKPSPSLVIVRGLLDPALIESLNAFSGAKSNYLGVPLLSSSSGYSVVAFLDGSIAVIGQPADVKAAIRRRGQNVPPSPVLAEGLARYEGQYDIWMVSAGSLAEPAKSPIGASLKWLERMDSFTGGLRFSPDLDLSAEMSMRNEKDVADMVDGLRWFAGVVQAQERSALSLEDMNFKVDGKRLSLSLQVPEQQIRAALQQRQIGASRAPRTAAVRPPEIGSGLPEPPSGTIRVQSSPADMGTVLLPIGKTN